MLISRRDLFVKTVLLVAATLIGQKKGWASLFSKTNDERILALKIVGTTSSVLSALKVGEAFLKEYPEERNITRLVPLLCQGYKKSPDELMRMDRKTLIFWQREEVFNDFKVGRVIKVQGWLLSIFEARVCALVSMTFSHH